MTIRECYDRMGGDYEDLIGRLRKESLIEKFLVRFPEDPSYDELVDSMDKGDVISAFRAAHTLKGVCQNLALSKLFSPVYEMTEALRGEDMDSAKTYLPQVVEEYDATLRVIEDFAKDKI